MSNVQCFRYPTSSADDRIRVTEQAIEPLFFALVHSIEFQSSLGSKTGPPTIIKPKVESSTVLGGVDYVVCEQHNGSLLETLPKAVEAAKKVAIPKTSEGVAMKLRVRIMRKATQRGVFWTSEKTVPVVEWEFKVFKTIADFSQRFLPPQSPQPVTPSVGGGGVPALPSSLVSPNTAALTHPPSASSASSHQTVYSNDPAQVREALMFIAEKSFEGVDTNLCEDLRAGELSYEVDVIYTSNAPPK